VTEVAGGPYLRHPNWEALADGLVCGITEAAAGSFSLAMGSEKDAIEAYASLGQTLGFRLVAVGRQVHGCDVATVTRVPAEPAGGGSTDVRVAVRGRFDGLVTADPDVLLASTAADCVPVHLLDPGARVIGLVHAGWRGVAGGILERGLERLFERGGDRERVRVHLGPAICGGCYEVDRPVLDRFGIDADRARLDLRGVLVAQALGAGVQSVHITVSALCTSCGNADLHSHRASGGEAGRMAAFMGFHGI